MGFAEFMTGIRKRLSIFNDSRKPVFLMGVPYQARLEASRWYKAIGVCAGGVVAVLTVNC